ncbi:hypothetical protein P5G65_21795 [Paenibacillus chondroitinus]|uniref:Uncharacterized protein n=1 Tax=Paenibacillus chondroitinus TaxID=59842 RepID=A0ABU6DFL3_9BACL|nr:MULTISPECIES: hypothetical protein [Paenibacillus]MCY9659121.1 hypothetical protein [Paenibacillus anseongense]MEB4796544.1 hypothetical protein [Paenibacillus chondroitinus]
MSSDFIQIKSLEGDLKMSHKKKDYGLTITTKELILHKPHMNYYFKLEKIISIVPYEISSTKAMSFVNARSGNQETTHLAPGSDHFRIYVQGATVHNRSGLFELGPINIVIPIYPVMLGAISECLTRTGLISL